MKITKFASTARSKLFSARQQTVYQVAFLLCQNLDVGGQTQFIHEFCFVHR